MTVDLLIVNSIGPGWTLSTAQKGLGGSELEISLVAHALVRRGYSVVVANGVPSQAYEQGVRYVPLASVTPGIEARALWIERMTPPPMGVKTKRIIVRATDVCCAPYDIHKPMLESGQASLVANTQWQADGFAYAKHKILIPPALDCSLGAEPPPEKVPGRFVYASAPMKGLGATIELWRSLKSRHGKVLKKAKLILALPGLSDFYGDMPIPLSEADKAIGISYAASPSLVEYRRLIASAEGLFYVNRMPETFACVAAFAERYRTRTHILCLNGKGGIPEALVNAALVTEDPAAFERDFMLAWQAADTPLRTPTLQVPDRSPDALAALWDDALCLGRASSPAVFASSDPEPEQFKSSALGRAGMHLGLYANDGGQAQRYWAHDRILVGGTILDGQDAAKLKTLGVTHVLSAESERDDTGKWPSGTQARHAWQDDGLDVSEATLHKVFDFSRKVLDESSSILYAHCRMGGSRGPSLAYAACRSALKLSPAESMRLIRQSRGVWTPHLRYIDSIERALTTWQGAKGTLAEAQEAVVEAYRGTPTPQSRADLIHLRPDDPPSCAPESLFPQEDLPENRVPFGPELGARLSLLRESICSGGSEFGLGLSLVSLVASTRAVKVVEIGRFRGFATLALATGLALADEGWREPGPNPRPDVNYDLFLGKRERKLVSIDPFPDAIASSFVERAGLSRYVEMIDKRSDDVDPSALGPIDVLLIDGEHTLGQVQRDIARYVPHVKPGGYFVLHDYYGWYGPSGENGSPIKKAIDTELEGFERLLVDTGFASFVMLRKTKELDPKPTKIPVRKDGRPTVGLVIVAIGREASTVVARAIISAFKMVDAVTVVIDPAGGGAETAEVARHIGADVYLRPTPAIDWDKGIGAIAGARNDALAIAERKTDYVFVLDADDTVEGKLPDTLTHDLYELDIHDANVIYRRIQIWKSGRGFRYSGIIHETLSCQGTCGRISGLKYQRRFGGGHQDSVPASVKYLRHAKLVSKWLIDHPEDARAQFYLAQSYRDAGKPDDAIREYERRIEMTSGNDEERAFSAFQIARIMREQGKDPAQAYIRAFELRPTRAEPLYELAVWLRSDDRKRFALGMLIAKQASAIELPHQDALFIDPSVYQWRSLEEYAIHAYWAGDKRESRRAYEQLRGRVPDGHKAHIEDMLAMCIREGA